jgi:hypothetical protein
MLRVCSVTPRETLDISAGLHANMSLLHQRKSMSSLSYLGSEFAPICTVLAGSLASICTTLESSGTLKVLDVDGMAGWSGIEGTQRLSSLKLAATTIEAATMLSYSQFSARCVLASMVITLAGPNILSLR